MDKKVNHITVLQRLTPLERLRVGGSSVMTLKLRINQYGFPNNYFSWNFSYVIFSYNLGTRWRQ